LRFLSPITFVPLNSRLSRLAGEQIDSEDNEHPDQHAQDLGEPLCELSDKPTPAGSDSLLEAQNGKGDLAKVQVNVRNTRQGNKGERDRQSESPEDGSERRFKFDHGSLLS
jgi:hypothetical protein